MVEGAKTDRRRPRSSERDLLRKFLVGKSEAGQATLVQEGKSLAFSCPKCGWHHDIS